MNKISYMRQTDLFDPLNPQYKIIVLGAGSLGSFITLNLAKLGFDDITVYDFDRVEIFNIPNQFYKVSDVGKYKIDALKEIVKEFADVDININKEEVTKDTKFPLSLSIIFILTFDTLKNRKMFFDLITKNDFRVCHVIDSRCGGEEYNLQNIFTGDNKQIESWKKSFDITPATLPCGAKSICYTNLSVASEVCNIVKKINNGEKYPTRLFRHMQTYRIINDQDTQS